MSTFLSLLLPLLVVSVAVLPAVAGVMAFIDLGVRRGWPGWLVLPGGVFLALCWAAFVATVIQLYS